MSLLATCFTQPTFQTFRALLLGQVSQTGSRTVCGMLVGARLSGVWEHSRAHRFFSQARWSPDELGLRIAVLIIERLTDPETPLTVAIDDTLLQRWGRRVWGCFYHHDATANSDRSAVAWGNNWLVVGIVVRIAILDRSQSRVKVIRGDMARALIIVDFQNDFTPGGALPVPDGDQISERINELAASGEFDLVVATRDWHPPEHGSFATSGGRWPQHCVAGSDGAQLHSSLDQRRVDVVIDKGQDPDTEGYSGFEGTGLERLLRDRGIDEVAICGLATDYCVKNTAIDALRAGFRVCVDERGIRGVDVHPGDCKRAIGEMREAGAVTG